MKSEEIVSYFTSKGYAPHQAAAIAGNLTQESGLDPEAINKKSGAFGLAQWLGPRKKALNAYAERQGTYAADPGTQLDFINHELNSTEKRARNKLMAAKDVSQATTAFSDHFERAGKNEKNNSRRISMAEKALNFVIPTASADETPYFKSEQPLTEEQFLATKQQSTSPLPDKSNAEQPLTEEQFLAAKKPPVVTVSSQDATQAPEVNPLQHPADVMLRGVIEGVAAIPQNFYNTAQIIPRAIQDYTGYKPPIEAPASFDTEQYGSKFADMLGLQKATEDDSILYPVSKGVGGFAIPAAGIGKIKSGAGIISNVAKQIPGLVGGQVSQEAAKQMGGGETAQIAANIAGNVLGGKIAPTIAGIASTTKRGLTGGMGTQKGLEAVAGRLLNRAAGVNSPDAIEALNKGAVPTVGRPLTGYEATSSQVAGVPGISTVMRQIGMSPEGQTAIKARDFTNAKAISDYAAKAAGSAERAAKISEDSYNRVQSIAEPMRSRNLPVDTSTVITRLDEAIARHQGNDLIVPALEDLKSKLPVPGTGFNSVLNFKQAIDQKLRSKQFTDPLVASTQRAGTALKDVKKELSNALTNTELGFKEYVKDQAVAMKQLDQRELAGNIIEKTKSNAPLVGWVNGAQESINQIRPHSIAQVLKEVNGTPINANVSKLSPAQRRILTTVKDYSQLPARAQMGSMVGSPTAQNLNVNSAIYQDLVNAGLGDGKVGNLVGGLGAWSGNLPVVKNITKAMGDSNNQKLMGILTKAELDPKYAADLMKKYGLGHMSFNDPAGRAALRGLMQNR